MLHTLNKSPFEKNSLETCLRLIDKGSSILFIEDGVYSAIKNTKYEQKIIKSLETRKKEEVDIFFKNLNKIMNVYMKENSINIIIDKKNVVMASVKNDISNEIIVMINK